MAYIDLDKTIDSGSSTTATVISSPTYWGTKDGYVDTSFVNFTMRYLNDSLTTYDVDWNASILIWLPDTTGRAGEIASLDNSVTFPVWTKHWYMKLNKHTKLVKASGISMTVTLWWVNVWTLAVGDEPYWIAIDSGYAYVVNANANNVSKIDLSTFTVVWTVTVGTNPRWIATNNGYAYVTNVNSDNVSKIDLSTFTVVWTLAVGDAPYWIAIDSGYAYVTNDNSNNVSKIDLSTFTVVWTVTVGTNPRWIATNNGYAYVTNASSDNVNKIDLTRPDRTNKIELNWTEVYSIVTLHNQWAVNTTQNNSYFVLDTDLLHFEYIMWVGATISWFSVDCIF